MSHEKDAFLLESDLRQKKYKKLELSFGVFRSQPSVATILNTLVKNIGNERLRNQEQDCEYWGS